MVGILQIGAVWDDKKKSKYNLQGYGCVSTKFNQELREIIQLKKKLKPLVIKIKLIRIDLILILKIWIKSF